ncbi:MAG: hypothetical protein AB1673_14200 [Actinomycetota bacterium]|jgi:hypothetical protein
MTDASDADRLEQSLPIEEEDEVELARLADLEPEVPEADAVEQALPADVNPDEDRR